ncbi:MAG: NAD-dependent nucleoside diphosphate-sugar epimerase/dehydratase [Armatimonadota bacterium]|nr:MAG: NAD-dependent nucleoside diphosphate-sugar epimerase/dehydratase [Armatimonadota bacterium]
MNIGVTGATGFVGSHLCRLLVERGHRVTALVRPGSTRARPSGGGVRFAEGDITRPETLPAAFQGCDVVVNLVGIIRETRDQTFERIHAEGAAAVALAAREAGVRRLVHMSAVGTRPHAPSAYHRTKWLGEEAVRASGLEWVILRPSLIFGIGDGFTTTMIDLVRRAPVIPVIGSGTNLMQPIAVEDVCAAFASSAEEDCHCGQTYELGGPEQITYEQIVRMVARELGVRRPFVHLPVWMMMPLAGVLSRLSARFPLTPDQIRMLQEDNVAQPNHALTVFGLELMRFEDGLKRIVASVVGGRAA